VEVNRRLSVSFAEKVLSGFIPCLGEVAYKISTLSIIVSLRLVSSWWREHVSYCAYCLVVNWGFSCDRHFGLGLLTCVR